jgi:hypothetical protein
MRPGEDMAASAARDAVARLLPEFTHGKFLLKRIQPYSNGLKYRFKEILLLAVLGLILSLRKIF